MNETQYKKFCAALHEQACRQGEMNYTDPKTGYRVFTRLYHLKRGHCCKSGCRHCAYGFNESVEIQQ